VLLAARISLSPDVYRYSFLFLRFKHGRYGLLEISGKHGEHLS
jgi:hypothetical protein